VLAEHSLWVARRRHRKVNAQGSGKAVDESAPEGKHRTADRLAEKAGERRVIIPLFPGRQALSARERSIFSRVAEGRSGRNAASRSF
jgi:hypothetical protein